MSEVEEVPVGGLTRWLHLLSCVVSLTLLSACATHRAPPLEAMDRTVDLERFMGDWYVIGFIPITLPFFSEEGAHNAVETYRLTDEGVIETTYTFRDGGFDGPEKRFTPKGWVHDHETNAEWRMQFLWPFKAAYLIVYVDDEYQKTIIGVPDRGNVWIMSRDPEMSEAEYQRMLSYAEGLGYDVTKVKRVPQRWLSSRQGANVSPATPISRGQSTPRFDSGLVGTPRNGSQTDAGKDAVHTNPSWILVAARLGRA